ncbi:MAG: nuclear transport factor 2 family protein [Gammaproteobacteria bacterium]
MDITEAINRLEIQQLLTTYASAVDQKNFDKFYDIFTTDAFIDYTAVGGIKGNLDQIVGYLKTALEYFPHYQHFNTNYDISFLDEYNATGSIMCFNPMQSPDGNTFFLGMWYHDRYIKENGIWKISERIERSSWNHNVPADIKVD